MILSFKTKINGKNTHFPEKILLSIEHNKLTEEPLNFGIASKNHSQKIHTIRKNEKNRWKKGVMIDFYINARQKNMFQFAPRIPLIGKQRIFMTFIQGRFEVSIEDKYMYYPEIEKLAINDGFDCYEDFRDYFVAEMIEDCYAGYVLHWTAFKY
jgi:hypothetical protein